MSTDRSRVVWEVYPGAANFMDRLIEEGGGLVCEACFEATGEIREWPHGDCAGPGMPRTEAEGARDV